MYTYVCIYVYIYIYICMYVYVVRGIQLAMLGREAELRREGAGGEEELMKCMICVYAHTFVY